MAGAIIWYLVTIGCGLLFYSIGAYAKKYEKPMHFYSGTEVKESEISNIPQYNQENSKMWKCYSLWYFASGLTYTWNWTVSFVLFILSCTIGIYILVKTYHKIYDKYKVGK